MPSDEIVAEAAELLKRMAREHGPMNGWAFTGRYWYTDDEGNLSMLDATTVWYEFATPDGVKMYVRFDDDKFHELSEDEFGPVPS